MKKNLISILILALLIVNIVLTAIMMFSVTSTNSKTAALVTDIASAISLDIEGMRSGASAVPLENTVTYTIADMTILLKDDTKTITRSLQWFYPWITGMKILLLMEAEICPAERI